MSDQIKNLVRQISLLQNDLKYLLEQQEDRMLYEIKGKKIKFASAVSEAHQKIKVGVFEWLRTSRPACVLSAPFVYGLIVPLLLLDLGLTIYQLICFRLYKIPLVKRSDYMVFDRYQLGYLNIFEKLNCLYCSYANGLIVYARELASCTEQFWCPIKHAHKVLDSHSRYMKFIDYGDAEDYPRRLRELQDDLLRSYEKRNSNQSII